MTLLAKGRANTTAAAAASGRLQRVLYAVQLDPSRKFGSMEEQIFLTASAFQERGGLFLPVFLRSRSQSVFPTTGTPAWSAPSST